MIQTYYRPATLDEALTLLAQPNTVPLGGGTLLSQRTADSVSIVDLQLLGLNTLRVNGNDLEIGATVTLEELLQSEHCPAALKTALKLEAPLNLRNSATVAGTLVSADGRSTFGASLLALDAKMTVTSLQSPVSSNQSSVISVGEFIALRPKNLITKITIPLNTKLAFEFVSRTPADKPILSASLAHWPSGRTRLVLGGWGKSPTLAMDGTQTDDVQSAARNACHEASDDYASAEYRMDVALTLAMRCVSQTRSEV